MENRELGMAEILTGLEFDRLILLAQARIQALGDARGVYESHLRQVHECGDGWALNDWTQGFVRPVEDDGQADGQAQDGQAQGQPQRATPLLEEVGDGN